MGDGIQNTQFDHGKTTDVSRREFLLTAASLSAVSALSVLPVTALAQNKGDGLQKVLDDSVAANRFPFVAGMTGKASGVTFAGASGEAAPGMSAAPDTVFRIFSMTKAIGSTAAMILIEQGKMDFDTPVQEVLPEFANIQVLDGWDGDKPRLRAPKVKATARHLATHTSGLEYEFWRPEVGEYLGKT